LLSLKSTFQDNVSAPVFDILSGSSDSIWPAFDANDSSVFWSYVAGHIVSSGQMDQRMDWQRIVAIVTRLEASPGSDKTIKEFLALLGEFRSSFAAADAVARNLMSFLFVKSVLPLLNNDSLAPSIIEGILLAFCDILDAEGATRPTGIDISQLVCVVLRYGLEHENARQLFEEIGRAGFDCLERLVPETVDVGQAAFLVSVALDYATKSTFVHGERALAYLERLLGAIPAESVRKILPGVSVAMRAVAVPKHRHQIVVRALGVLNLLWVDANLTADDVERLGELIARVFEQDLQHWRARRARVVLGGTLVGSEVLKEQISPCIRCLFAGIADASEGVRAAAVPVIEKVSGSLVISAEFEQCVEDLRRVARRPDDAKRLGLLQTLSGLIEINRGKDNGFDAQLLTSLHPLASALIFVSEFQQNDSRIYEVGGGFIVRRRLYLPSDAHMSAFGSILSGLPTEDFVEILIDILADAPNYAPEIFWLFGAKAGDGPRDLMMSVLENAQWWQPRDGLARSVMTLEVVLEVTAKLCGTSMLQKLLYRVIECLASEHPSVEQTASAVLQAIAPGHDVAALLMSNVDYITDRLIARMAFVDVSPEVLVLFPALLSVDGDIADLLTHLMPRIYELLDTRAQFARPILGLLPRAVAKLPAEAKNVIDRSIHFVLDPSVAVECAAMDAIVAAVPAFVDEEELLPMVHQMWAPTLLILRRVADCSNPAARRAVLVFQAALRACRSFVRHRIRELQPLFAELIAGNLEKMRENERHVQALAMLNTVLDTVLMGLEPEPVFDSQELEIFKMLATCFEGDVVPEIRDKAVRTLALLYRASPAFVWALMLEAAQRYPGGDPPVKPSRYLPDLTRGVRVFDGRLLA